MALPLILATASAGLLFLPLSNLTVTRIPQRLSRARIAICGGACRADSGIFGGGVEPDPAVAKVLCHQPFSCCVCEQDLRYLESELFVGHVQLYRHMWAGRDEHSVCVTPLLYQQR